MVLPTAKRPKEVEEELQELRTKQHEELKLRIDLNKIFIDSMKTWYNGLKGEEKSELTPKLLKRKAISCCFRLNLVYDSLPLDWVKRLQDECGLKLHAKQKQKLESVDEDHSEAETAMSGSDDVDMPPKTIDKPNSKKYLDLTKEPPPPEWMRAYAEGNCMPRILKTLSTEDTNILFWDYSPTLMNQDGTKAKLAPVPRTNLNDIQPKGSASGPKRNT